MTQEDGVDGDDEDDEGEEGMALRKVTKMAVNITGAMKLSFLLRRRRRSTKV